MALTLTTCRGKRSIIRQPTLHLGEIPGQERRNFSNFASLTRLQLISVPRGTAAAMVPVLAPWSGHGHVETSRLASMADLPPHAAAITAVHLSCGVKELDAASTGHVCRRQHLHQDA